MRRVVDGQVQRVNLCAAVGISVTVGVVAALSVGSAVPHVVFAFRDGGGHVRRVVDRQVECINLSTSIGIRVTEGVITARRVGRAVPHVAFAFRDGGGHVRWETALLNNIICWDAIWFL